MVINHSYFHLRMWLKKLNAWDKKLFPGKPVHASKARFFALATIFFEGLTLAAILTLPIRAGRFPAWSAPFLLFVLALILMCIQIVRAVRSYRS